MNTNKSNNALAIIGLVLGIIAIGVSFFRWVGSIAFIPGVIGLILGVIALLKAKDNGSPKGLSIAVIIVSALACAISGYQMSAIGSMVTEIKTNMKDYTNCEEISKDFKAVKIEMVTLTKEMEEDKASFSSIKQITKLGIKMDHIQKESKRLDCDIEFNDFDPSDLNESSGEAEGEADGEAESIEEEKGN